jgi:DNA primase
VLAVGVRNRLDTLAGRIKCVIIRICYCIAQVYGETPAMTDAFTLDVHADDQKLLAQVVGYYHATLQATPAALDYLRSRGITNPDAVTRFRIGFADRSFGLKLPAKQIKAGATIRERLQRLGLYRDSGHEHFRGSITFPIMAADGSGQIVDIYGRKMLGEQLRKGTTIHTHLNDKKLGVWNIEAFPASDEMVLCGSLWDALTFWNCGYRNVTTMFGNDALTDDLLAAFAEFRVKRILTTCSAVSERLIAAGLDVFVVQLPHGVDVNAFALQASNPADALGSLLRGAGWEGNGKAVPVPASPILDDSDDEELLDDDDDMSEDDDPPTLHPERTASPMPKSPEQVEADVSEDEVNVTFGNRRYRVRGIGKNATLDLLRVNVLVSTEHALHVDTFDLYSAKHRKAFQDAAASELNVEEATIKRDLGRLLLALEDVQDARQQARKPVAQALPEMTAAERDAAMTLLRDPNLLDRIVSDFSVVGEATNKLVGYLAAVSRKLDTPLAVIIQSTSAAGKSTLMEAILGFVPPEDVVKFSAMTGQSLYYMGDDSLKHKILAIVEEEGAARASYALKLLQSEGELRIASTGKDANTGRLTTQEYRVEGPVMIFLTTTSISVDEELLNRCVVLTVNEDREQTRAIHQIQRAKQTISGLLTCRRHRDTVTLHRNAQRLLKPLLVANPFAERLTFLDTTTRTRRDNQKYLTLIRSIALLRQHQRPVKTVEHQGEPVDYIEVTLEDIETANRLSAEVLGRSLDELPPQTRRLLDLIDEMVSERCRQHGQDRADFRFTQRDVREASGWGNTQLKIHMKRLVEMELLLVHRDRQAKRFVYELVFTKPVENGGKVLAGLLNVEELRSGKTEHRSGHGRASVGVLSGHGRDEEIDATPCETGPNSAMTKNSPEHAHGA